MYKKKIQKRLTIMVPAFNEEENLKDTILEIKAGLNKRISDFEIIIINDGSKDKTGEIADKLARKDKKIKVIHQDNHGLGYCYRKGLEMANFEYYMFVPGDNQFPKEGIKLTLNKLGQADIVIPYVTNMHIRPPIRQAISFLFTFLINLLFNLRVSYYNSQVIHRTDLLRKVSLKTNGFAYQAEILVKLLKSSASFVEVGYEMSERSAGVTKAFTLKNIKSVLTTVMILFWEIQILKNAKRI